MELQLLLYVCARFGLQCVVYMGAQDMERQVHNVLRMRLLGVEVWFFSYSWSFCLVFLKKYWENLKQCSFSFIFSQNLSDFVSNVHASWGVGIDNIEKNFSILTSKIIWMHFLGSPFECWCYSGIGMIDSWLALQLKYLVVLWIASSWFMEKGLLGSQTLYWTL
jgi:hypothetical protein